MFITHTDRSSIAGTDYMASNRGMTVNNELHRIRKDTLYILHFAFFKSLSFCHSGNRRGA